MVDTTLITSKRDKGGEILGNLCNKCQNIGRNYAGPHHTPPDLILSARMGCLCCRLIIETAGNEILLTDTRTPFMGTSDNIGYKLIEDSDYGSKLSLAFDLVRQRDETPLRENDEICLKVIPQNVACNESYEAIIEWVKVCMQDHKECQQGCTLLPTRVIDVNGEDPCLVASNGQSAPYITLSHCWGSRETLTTTLATLMGRFQKIRICEFPATFRDAITITRKLGVRYLWIDSICIIQDSREDWEFESRQMKNYYRNSYLTISALISPDSHHGILCSRPVIHVKLASEPNLYIRKHLPDHFWVFLQENALNNRAWAFQERLLSTRIIHYTEEEIFWECQTYAVRQGSTVVSAERAIKLDITEGDDFKRILTYLEPESSERETAVGSIWYRLVTQYSRRQLTKATDRFPAISGLASRMFDATGHTYLAGVWKENLYDLLWFLDMDTYHGRSALDLIAGTSAEEIASMNMNRLAGLSAEEYGYQAPSWSWASIPRPVDYNLRDHETPKFGSERDMKIIDTSITYVGDDPFGQISGGYMHIVAYVLALECKPGRVKVEDPFENSMFLWCSALIDKSRGEFGYGYHFGRASFDDDLDRLFGPALIETGSISCTAVWVAEVTYNYSESENALYCLLLQKVHPEGDTYRRIGIIRTSQSDCKQDYKTAWPWELQKLRIV